jgi:hypothetical protein
MKSLSSLRSAPGLAFTGAPESLGAWIMGSIGGTGAMGSALNTVARIAARACSAAVAPPLESSSLRGSLAVAELAMLAAAGDGIEADVRAAVGF